MGRWVLGRGACVVGDNRSRFVDSSSWRRLLLVEFKGTVILHMTLHIHEKVSPIKFSKENVSAKCLPRVSPIFTHAPCAFCVFTEIHMRLRKPLPVSKIIAAFHVHFLKLDTYFMEDYFMKQIMINHYFIKIKLPLSVKLNPLRPNNDLSQTSHCNIKGLSVSEVMRIEN